MTDPIQSVPPPDAVLMQMLFGAQMQRSVCLAVRLGIPDLLAEGTQTAEELAAKTDTHAPSLYRLLRTLASIGVFAENAEKKFELTPISALLRGGAPHSMRDFSVMMGEEWIWQAWGELPYSVKTGGVAHEKAQGMGSFEFFQKNAEAGKVFQRHAVLVHIAPHQHRGQPSGCQPLGGFPVAIGRGGRGGGDAWANLVGHFFHADHQRGVDGARAHCQHRLAQRRAA